MIRHDLVDVDYRLDLVGHILDDLGQANGNGFVKDRPSELRAPDQVIFEQKYRLGVLSITRPHMLYYIFADI